MTKDAAGLEQIIANSSGSVSIRPHARGVWLVVEDAQDICSIALSLDELVTLWERATHAMCGREEKS